MSTKNIKAVDNKAVQKSKSVVEPKAQPKKADSEKTTQFSALTSKIDKYIIKLADKNFVILGQKQVKAFSYEKLNSGFIKSVLVREKCIEYLRAYIANENIGILMRDYLRLPKSTSENYSCIPVSSGQTTNVFHHLANKIADCTISFIFNRCANYPETLLIIANRLRFITTNANDILYDPKLVLDALVRNLDAKFSEASLFENAPYLQKITRGSSSNDKKDDDKPKSKAGRKPAASTQQQNNETEVKPKGKQGRPKKVVSEPIESDD